MIIPVRCFTCNKVIGHLWEDFNKKIKTSTSNGISQTKATCDALDELQLDLYCCRRMLLGHIDVIDTLLLYSNNQYEKGDPLLVKGLYDELKPDSDQDDHDDDHDHDQKDEYNDHDQDQDQDQDQDDEEECIIDYDDDDNE